MLGHTTAGMRLDYGHLFPDQFDEVADRLDVIGRATADNSADFLRAVKVLRIFCGLFADSRSCVPFVIKGQRTPKGPDLRLCTWARPGSNRR